MKSSELKTEIMREYIYGKGYLGLFTESWGACDVLGVRRSLFLVEFEVKVSRSDLLGEINCIHKALGRDIKFNSGTKFYKHQSYLRPSETYFGKVDGYKQYSPNQFYFVVPNELALTAAQGVTGTPYGVIAYGVYNTGYQNRHQMTGLHEVVKAQYLHKNKLDPENMMRLVRKSSVELYETRKKLELLQNSKEADAQ